jgi:polyhydroxybutyrate depolymerase
LVFVCHGYTGTAQGIMNYSDFNQLADEYGFAVCYPQGTQDGGGNTFFNVGYDFQNNETVDDVAFLQNLNNYFQNTYSLAADKVFCTGMSNGGDLCYMLACQASETFRAVAPIAGMIMEEIMDDCNPSSEVSIFEIHGTNDNVTYYDGDPTNQDGWGAYPSIPETMSFFNSLFGLTLQSSENLPNTDTNDGSTVSSEKYGAENSCSEVWLYTVQGGGHDWPGAYGNMDIEASREAWLFFDQLCEPITNLSEITPLQSKKLMRVLDLMGREVNKNTTGLVLNQYSDGSLERIFVNPN